jgi:hypothetical protein
MLIPNPDPDFLPIPDPGGQEGTGSRIQIRTLATGMGKKTAAGRVQCKLKITEIR